MLKSHPTSHNSYWRKPYEWMWTDVKWPLTKSVTSTPFNSHWKEALSAVKCGQRFRWSLTFNHSVQFAQEWNLLNVTIRIRALGISSFIKLKGVLERNSECSQRVKIFSQVNPYSIAENLHYKETGVRSRIRKRYNQKCILWISLNVVTFEMPTKHM
jgi:hypothetical protein